MRQTVSFLLCLLFALPAFAQERKVCTPEERQQYIRGLTGWLHCLPDDEHPDPEDRRRFAVGFSMTKRRFATSLNTETAGIQDHLGKGIQPRFRGFINDYLWRDGTIGSVFGPYFGHRTSDVYGKGHVLSTNTAPGFQVGDKYALYRSRMVDVQESGTSPFSIDFTSLVEKTSSYRFQYGFRYGGSAKISERSDLDFLRVDSVDSELLYFPGTGPILSWDMDLSRRYTIWSSETTVKSLTLYGGVEYDLLSGKWYNFAAGGGVDLIYVGRSGTWTRTEYAYAMFAPEIAAPQLALEQVLIEISEETGIDAHSFGEALPYVSASAQVWPFRRVGFTGQVRWYPWLAPHDAPIHSLFDDYSYSASTRHWNVSGGVVVNVTPGRRDRIE